jgi:preprotein translocase subunit SecE
MARSPSAPGRRPGGEASRRAFNFRSIGEIVTELRRVTWPNRQETTRLTIMVITVSAVVGILLGLIDLIFARLFGVLLGS